MSANPRPKILLLIPHLGGGGAERVAALLVRGLPAEKFELHLGLITQAQTSEALPNSVNLHALGAPRVRAGAFRLLRLVHRLKPELILSGMAHLNFLVLLLRPFFPRGTRVLVRQNSTVSASLAFGGVPCYTRLLYRLLYRRADRVICQTQSMADDLARELGVPENRLAVLPNPVDVDEVRASIGLNPSPQTSPGPRLLAVGRLAAEKGFDLLLRAMVSVRKEFPKARLLIAGEGPEETALKDLSRVLGLDATVHFAGYIDRPWTLFPTATLFWRRLPEGSPLWPYLPPKASRNCCATNLGCGWPPHSPMMRWPLPCWPLFAPSGRVSALPILLSKLSASTARFRPMKL